MTAVEDPALDVAPSRAHRGPAPFSPSYDKARRSYGVATALLLAWALVGIELGTEPLSSVRVTLKSPEAAPYVFIAAVLYFAFRFTVEWYQADASRRALRASRVDYCVAHALAAMSIAVFAGQKILQVQLATVFIDLVPRIMAFSTGWGSYRFVVESLRMWRQDRRWGLFLMALTISGDVVLLIWLVHLSKVGVAGLGVLLIAGLVVRLPISQLIDLVAQYVRRKL